MSSYIQGLSYAGVPSLTERWNRPVAKVETISSIREREKAERDARYNRQAAFVLSLTKGLEKKAIYRSGLLIREVQVIKFSNGFCKIFYDGCTLTVSPHDLHPE